LEKVVVDSSAEGEQLVSATEMAKILGCSRTYFYRLVRQGRAPDPRPRRGIPASEVRAWLKARAKKEAARAAVVRELQSLYAASAPDGGSE
jgi:excisionase family DNA binding protein